MVFYSFFIYAGPINAVTIYNSDGFGYSGTMDASPIIFNEMTGYNSWPAGFTKADYAFYSGVHEGSNIWMTPYSADRVIKVNTNTGEMIGYNSWPAGFTKGNNAFRSSVYDGTNIWLIPFNADRVIKVNTNTGEMIGYDSWPAGFTKGFSAFAGSVYDGTNIWMIPHNADRVIKINTNTGEMTGYNSWPAGFTKGFVSFAGGVYDGTNVWMIPHTADRVIKVNTNTGEMIGYDSWPAGFTKGAAAFTGGVYDGSNVWMIPQDADRVIKVNANTGEMTGYNSWPAGFTKGGYAFVGGVYDGSNVWMIPLDADRVIKVNASTGEMTGYNSWPAGYTGSFWNFTGGIYDGSNIWMIPHNADRVIKISTIPNAAPTLTSLTATPATNGTGNVSIVATVSDADANTSKISYHYESGTCGSFNYQDTTTTTLSASVGTGSVVILNNEATNISTASANTVTSTWNTLSDSLSLANGPYCIYAFANDGTVDSSVVTTTVTLDNVAPDYATITSFDNTSTTVYGVWGAVSDTNGPVLYQTQINPGSTSIYFNGLNTNHSNLTPNTQYSWQIRTKDAYGNTKGFNTSTSTYTNPAQPLSVSAIANGQTATIVSWEANNNPTSTAYRVYNVNKGTLSDPVYTTKTTITGLSSASNYTFKVRAYYNSDNTTYVESDATQTVTTAAPARTVVMTLLTSDDNVIPAYTFVGVRESHTVQLEAIVTSTDPLVLPKARLTLRSTPVTVTLAAGESQNVDTNGNGTNDTTVTVNSVDENTGEVNFTLIHIPQGGSMIVQNPPKVINSSGRALSINEDAKTTVSKIVKLKLDISNASQMAVSNDPDFTNASFETYSSSKEWTLTDGNGTKIVYVKFRAPDGSSIVYSDTIELMGQSFADPNSIKNQELLNKIEDKISCPVITEQSYQVKGEKAVYYVTKECTKRVFKRSEVYFTYFGSWKEVKSIEKDILNKISNDKLDFMPMGPKYDPKYGALVKVVNDPKVYLLLNENKYWITNENTFNKLNYNWNWIEDVDQRLLDKYTTKEEILNIINHPNYTLVKYQNDPKVYRIEPNSTDITKQVKRHIPNEAEFNKLNFRFDRVVTIPATEVYETGAELKS